MSENTDINDFNFEEEAPLLHQLKQQRTTASDDVPADYFKTLQQRVVDRIEAEDAVDRLGTGHLKSVAPTLSKVDNQSVDIKQDAPAGYFDSLADRVQNRISAAEAAPVFASSDRKKGRIIALKPMPTLGLAASIAALISLGIWAINQSAPVQQDEVLAEIPTDVLDEYLDVQDDYYFEDEAYASEPLLNDLDFSDLDETTSATEELPESITNEAVATFLEHDSPLASADELSDWDLFAEASYTEESTELDELDTDDILEYLESENLDIETIYYSL